MSTVLFKVLAFVLMIALGYFAKASHLLQQEDSQILMKIIINITMPMALFIMLDSRFWWVLTGSVKVR